MLLSLSLRLLSVSRCRLISLVSDKLRRKYQILLVLRLFECLCIFAKSFSFFLFFNSFLVEPDTDVKLIRIAFSIRRPPLLELILLLLVFLLQLFG